MSGPATWKYHQWHKVRALAATCSRWESANTASCCCGSSCYHIMFRRKDLILWVGHFIREMDWDEVLISLRDITTHDKKPEMHQLHATSLGLLIIANLSTFSRWRTSIHPSWLQFTHKNMQHVAWTTRQQYHKSAFPIYCFFPILYLNKT